MSDLPTWNTDDAAACAAEVMRRADELATHTEQPGQLTCTYLSAPHRAAAAQLAHWMREAGFDDVREDAVGNVIGRYHARDAGVRDCVVTGSHYDTVRNGGRYDGRLGILLPLAIVGRLHARGQRLPVALELVAFSEEEGVRYGSSFLASSAYTGHFDTALLDRKDADGITLAQALADAGLPPTDIPSAAVDATGLRHYFEIHIEQGPVLLDRDLPLGAVSAIAGSVRRRLTWIGLASHAGTTPMDMRRDAACAAAELILYVERRCSQQPGLVGTVGQLAVPNGSINVIPGRCTMSLDVRAGEDGIRDAALADIEAEIARIAARRNLRVEVEELMRVPAAPCAPAYREQWERAIAAQGVAPFTLPSGAGHDAMMLARIVPVSMLFVRCGNGGISHNPREIVDRADVALAASATAAFLGIAAAA